MTERTTEPGSIVHQQNGATSNMENDHATSRLESGRFVGDLFEDAITFTGLTDRTDCAGSGTFFPRTVESISAKLAFQLSWRRFAESRLHRSAPQRST